jgi:pyrophosphate--fructose-6-phosphate 1-phosphotransferase
MIGAKKTLVQKSGYFARSSAANQFDLDLIKSMTDLAVDAALDGVVGVVGQDEQDGDKLKVIDFDRIRGGKAFDAMAGWYQDLLLDINQPLPLGPDT